MNPKDLPQLYTRALNRLCSILNKAQSTHGPPDRLPAEAPVTMDAKNRSDLFAFERFGPEFFDTIINMNGNVTNGTHTEP